MKHITFITGNPNKAAQLASYLSIPVVHQTLDLNEIQSADLEEVITYKAMEAYRKLGSPVLVEDVSLVFHALNKLPGPLIKWFEKEIGVEGLCRILDSFDNRTATVELAYGLYDGKNLKIFRGNIEGTIAKLPTGNRGFGFDSIFIPNGYNQTRGEMSQEDFDQSSHRRKALEELEKYLKDEK